MTRQLSLLSDDEKAESFRRSAWRQLLELLNEYITIRGLKQVAFDLGARDADLANAMHERHRTPFKAEWLPVLLATAPDHRAISFLARLCGYELVARRELTAEQKLERLERLVREAMPKHADKLLDEAYGAETLPG